MEIINSNDTSIIAENALTIGLPELEQEYANFTKPTIEEIKWLATSFCEAYKRLENEKKINELSRRRRNIEFFENHVFDLFEEFQRKINLYFNQYMIVLYTYIDENGQFILSPQTDGSNALQALENDRGLEIVQYHLDKIETIFKHEDYDSSLLDATGKDIYYRWNRAREHCKKLKGRYLPILWKINGEWGGAQVNNLGTIAEAYANFYTNKYDGFIKGNNEQNVKTFIMDDTYGAYAVDNASGFLIGDVSVGHIHFAVKKDTASPMNLKRVYDSVREILDNFDIEKLKDEFITKEKERVKPGSQVHQLTSEQIAETVNGVIVKNLGKKKKYDVELRF